ncbi:MAG: hypothetical protein ACJA1Y_001382, partial [Burkholderiaceae bacterium]
AHLASRPSNAKGVHAVATECVARLPRHGYGQVVQMPVGARCTDINTVTQLQVVILNLPNISFYDISLLK